MIDAIAKFIFIFHGFYSLPKIHVIANNLLWGFHGEAGEILQIIIDSVLRGKKLIIHRCSIQHLGFCNDLLHHTECKKQCYLH